jgi:hypothetical protein
MSIIQCYTIPLVRHAAHCTSISHAGSTECQQSFRISNLLRFLATLLQHTTTEPPFITSRPFQPTDYLIPFGRAANSSSSASYLQSCRSNAQARGAFFTSLAALAALPHGVTKAAIESSKELLDDARRHCSHHRHRAVSSVSCEHS